MGNLGAPSTLSPYEIFFGGPIEGRGLDYFVDYERAFTEVKNDLRPILERIIEEFGPSVAEDNSTIHLNIDGAESWGDPLSAMQEVVEDALWRGTAAGYMYMVAQHLKKELQSG